MKTTKTMIRFFTIADYEEEEQFLREQHRKGWKLVRFIAPCFYRFEVCEPEDVVYRLDFREKNADRDVYLQMFSDYGWECCQSFAEWDYFRKKASEVEINPEIFSDNASKLELIRRVIRKRLLPLGIIFLFCVIPNTIRAVSGEFGKWYSAFSIFWFVMFVLYLWILGHSTCQFRKLKRKYGGEKQE
ncbi:DUF2812 domain-containing protein [Ruminococcus sp.]|uniref:DUF2812 domain-containing protein n=1 Tax=Ruminococcus sp. TaxID=41978 RepID=UPI0025E59DA7|nr:DUF2812 domain-containing protein [Ruminococcus sp.]